MQVPADRTAKRLDHVAARAPADRLVRYAGRPSLRELIESPADRTALRR